MMGGSDSRGIKLGWWRSVLVMVAAAAPAAAVVGGGPAAAPQPDAAVVFVQKHGLSARVEGTKDNRLRYYSFFGIRYAEPPVGEHRFQRPVRKLLAGEVNATLVCPACPQRSPQGAVRGHEDCLCLNIYAPQMPGSEQGSPVVFFIHGGNYRYGVASAYGGQHLTQKDTILVTAQYRLGSLGYFSTAEKDASGNAGLFDLRAAMIWVSEYIEFFGGDPKRVVVMGQGSGGSAASLIALSSEGRSARGVAALSGTPLSPGAVRPDPAKYAKLLANKTGCPEKPAERLVLCLKQLPVDKIVQADHDMTMDNIDTQKFLDDISGRTGAGARVEGADDNRGLPPLVEEPPADALSGHKQRCPLLTGVTSAETARTVYGKYSQFLTGQLAHVKDFIKNELVGGLKGVVGDIRGLVPAVLPSQVTQVIPVADYYQALFDNSLSAIDGLAQIAEATGDALFNFPAYQSVQAWGEASPAYLYSFEHVGNLSKGAHFLPGVPLADPATNISAELLKGPAHGDELAYIFEPLDEEGKPIGGEVSSTDARVRDSFVGLIAKFAHDLYPLEKNNKSKVSGKPFSKNNDQFIKINEEITLDKNFRYCQMGLWGNMGDRIGGALCKNLLSSLLNLPKSLNTLVNLPSAVDAKGVPVVNSLPIDTGAVDGLALGMLGKPGGTRAPKTTEGPKQVVQVTRKMPSPKQAPIIGGLFNRL